MTSWENAHHHIPQVEVSRVVSKGIQATDITANFLRATSGVYIRIAPSIGFIS